MRWIPLRIFVLIVLLLVAGVSAIAQEPRSLGPEPSGW